MLWDLKSGAIDGCLLSECEGLCFDIKRALQMDSFQAPLVSFNITGRNPSTSIGGGCLNKGFGWVVNGCPRMELPVQGKDVNREHDMFMGLDVWRRRLGSWKQAGKMAGDGSWGQSPLTRHQGADCWRISNNNFNQKSYFIFFLLLNSISLGLNHKYQLRLIYVIICIITYFFSE